MISERDMKLIEMSFLLYKELLVMRGAGKKAGFIKSQGAFMKRKTPSWRETVPRSQGDSFLRALIQG